ncbi:hypothetical protein R69749_07419 [Paraburkholderia domus]|nr:hypothetical protein R69749_07419 [Paraburkholderia domus]
MRDERQRRFVLAESDVDEPSIRKADNRVRAEEQLRPVGDHSEPAPHGLRFRMRGHPRVDRIVAVGSGRNCWPHARNFPARWAAGRGPDERPRKHDPNLDDLIELARVLLAENAQDGLGHGKFVHDMTQGDSVCSALSLLLQWTAAQACIGPGQPGEPYVSHLCRQLSGRGRRGQYGRPSPAARRT